MTLDLLPISCVILGNFYLLPDVLPYQIKCAEISQCSSDNEYQTCEIALADEEASTGWFHCSGGLLSQLPFQTWHLKNFFATWTQQTHFWLWCMLQLFMVSCGDKPESEPLGSGGFTKVNPGRCLVGLSVCTTETKSTLQETSQQSLAAPAAVVFACRRGCSLLAEEVQCLGWEPTPRRRAWQLLEALESWQY